MNFSQNNIINTSVFLHLNPKRYFILFYNVIFESNLI